MSISIVSRKQKERKKVREEWSARRERTSSHFTGDDVTRNIRKQSTTDSLDLNIVAYVPPREDVGRGSDVVDSSVLGGEGGLEILERFGSRLAVLLVNSSRDSGIDAGVSSTFKEHDSSARGFVDLSFGGESVDEEEEEEVGPDDSEVPPDVRVPVSEGGEDVG